MSYSPDKWKHGGSSRNTFSWLGFAVTIAVSFLAFTNL